MPRPSVALLVPVALAAAVLGAQPAKPRPSPTPTPPARKAPPRVFTNDDLEESRKKPSAVQNLAATGGTTSYEHASEVAEPLVTPTPDPDEKPPLSPEQERIEQLEKDIAALDAQAKQLLWQYLQSTDTNEILRLKAEQQGILDQLAASKAELARLREQGPATPAPVEPNPTRPPG